MTDQITAPLKHVYVEARIGGRRYTVADIPANVPAVDYMLAKLRYSIVESLGFAEGAKEEEVTE